MVNWKDPEVVLQSARALIILIHCAFAVYTYEYFFWMCHDKAFLLGKRKFGIGSALYLGTRYFGLIALTLCVRFVNVFDPDFNCQNWLYAIRAFAFTAVSCTSGLLYLRVVALSKENRYITVIFGAGYAVVWAFAGMAIHKTNAVYFPPLFTCAPVGTHLYAPNMIYPFAFDVACLGTMLFYLLRMKYGGALWDFLLQQGFVYAAAICSAYLFATLFIALDLNDPMADIGLIVILTTALLFGTRMQRDLEDFFETPREPTLISAAKSFGDGTTVTGMNKGQTYCPTCGGQNPAYCGPNGCGPSCGPMGCGRRGCGGGPRCAGPPRPLVDPNAGLGNGVQISVDVAVGDIYATDWKDSNHGYVQDDYEMGKVDSINPVHQQWGPHR